MISLALARAAFSSSLAFFFGLGEVLLRVVGGGEAFGDLLLAFLDGRDDVRPAELHHQPRHREEREALNDEGEVG